MSHDRRTNHGNAMHGIVTLIALVTVMMGGCKGHAQQTASRGPQKALQEFREIREKWQGLDEMSDCEFLLEHRTMHPELYGPGKDMQPALEGACAKEGKNI